VKRKLLALVIAATLTVALTEAYHTSPTQALARDRVERLAENRSGDTLNSPFSPLSPLTRVSPTLILRVILRTPTDTALLTSHYDVLEARSGNALFVLGDEAVMRDLQAQGFTVSVERRLRSGVDNQGQTPAIGARTFFAGYRTVVEQEAHLDAVATAHPELAKVITFGSSWLKANAKPGGHDLKAICITRRRAQDCALSPTTDKPRFFLMAAIHARELTTSEMAWRWIDYLVNNDGQDADVTTLLNTTEMWIVPVANPDGRARVEEGGNMPIYQRKNLNDSHGPCNAPTASFQIGVDLNRNSSFQWGIAGTSPITCNIVYEGDGPASEPEEQALESLMRSLFPVLRPVDLSAAAPLTTTGAMLTLHSFSDLVLLPWGWTECYGMACPAGKHAPNDAGLRAMAFRMSYYNGYDTGQGSELLYVTSGTTDDWAYGVLGLAAFTFEIGPYDGMCGGDFFVPYSCQDSTFWPLNRGAFVYAAKLARQPYTLANGPNVLSVTVGTSPSAAISNAIVISGTPFTVTAMVSDDALGTNGIGRPQAQVISASELYVDLPPWAGGTPITMTARDGAFDTPVEVTLAALGPQTLGLGRHTLFVRGRNAGGNWGPVTAQFVTVVGNRPLYFPFMPN